MGGTDPGADEARLALVNATANVVYRMGPDWREMRRLDGLGFIVDTEAPTIDWLETCITSCVRPASMGRRIKSSDPVMLVRPAANAAVERDERGIADFPTGRPRVSLSTSRPVAATAAAL